MKFDDKILTFFTLITNAYRNEENQEYTQQMTLDDENLTEDFTAMVFALHMFFNTVTGRGIDVIDFTHLMNKLAWQHLIEQHLLEEHTVEKSGAE